MVISNRVLLRYSGQPQLPIGKVDPFDLYSGEILCLHLEEEIDSRCEPELARSLGREVGLATPAQAPRFVVRTPTVTRYLRRHLTAEGESQVLRMLDLTGAEDLRSLPLTPRSLLGIEVAFRQHVVVIFSISGLDPLGVKKVLDHVQGFLEYASAILLSHPSTLGRECPECARCINVQR